MILKFYFELRAKKSLEYGASERYRAHTVCRKQTNEALMTDYAIYRRHGQSIGKHEVW